jgi:quercetin dioxygenase-like cupin family protein
MERIAEGEGDAGEPIEGVRLELLAGGERMRSQAFTIEPGVAVPEHSHDNEQVGYVTRGELTFLLDGDELVVGPGDSYAIAAGEVHGAENRGDEAVRGVEMFAPPRENPSWRDG